MVIGIILNFLKKKSPGFVNDASKLSIISIIRQKISNPALFARKHSVPLKWGPINAALPTRAQGWILTGYFIVFIVFMFIKYDAKDRAVLYDPEERQLSRQIGDRTATIAMSQLPMVFLFAGRNNIMLWLTGWSYDTFNLYHRWTSRVMYISAFVHAISYTILYKDTLGEVYQEEGYWKSGATSIAAGAFVLFFALRHFREHMYEIFLFLHWVFVIIFVIAVLAHTGDVGGIGWIIVSIGIWGFDRLVRLYKMFNSGTHCIAQAQAFANNTIVKLKISYSNKWTPLPGAFVFVYFKKPVSGSWQSHPFSCYPSPVAGEENKLVLCIRARNGKTKKLAQEVSMYQSRIEQIPVIIENYGQRFPLENFNTIVLIAGGVGVTAVYSYACQLNDLGDTRQISFIWIVKSTEDLEWFSEELENLEKGGNISITIYITGLPSKPEYNESEEDLMSHQGGNISRQEKSPETTMFDNKIINGRPNLSQVVQSYVDESMTSIAFMACGPPAMNDDMRYSVTKSLKGHKRGRIELFLEEFSW